MQVHIQSGQGWSGCSGVTPICFSATASIGAGLVLLGIGVATVRRANALGEVPYAAIPMLFGLQQLVEGRLWLDLPAQTATTHLLAVAYLLFSHVLWPIYVPLAVWLLEPGGPRRKLILGLAAAGTATGLFFLVALLAHPVFATIRGAHILYDLPHPYDPVALTCYVAATCLAPLLSSHRTVRLFAIILISSMSVTALAYVAWFASVWCFFAALTSGTVYLHFAGRSVPRPDDSILRR